MVSRFSLFHHVASVLPQLTFFLSLDGIILFFPPATIHAPRGTYKRHYLQRAPKAAPPESLALADAYQVLWKGGGEVLPKRGQDELECSHLLIYQTSSGYRRSICPNQGTKSCWFGGEDSISQSGPGAVTGVGALAIHQLKKNLPTQLDPPTTLIFKLTLIPFTASVLNFGARPFYPATLHKGVGNGPAHVSCPIVRPGVSGCGSLPGGVC